MSPIVLEKVTLHIAFPTCVAKTSYPCESQAMEQNSFPHPEQILIFLRQDGSIKWPRQSGNEVYDKYCRQRGGHQSPCNTYHEKVG